MKKPEPLKPRIAALERRFIREALDYYSDDPMQAAAALRIHVATLNRKIKGQILARK